MELAATVERPGHLKATDAMLVMRDEAEYMVEMLRNFEIEQVGSAEWLAQHEAIEKLNLQAHYNTMSHSNDFVMEALISLDKFGVLIHELLVIEVWMEKIFPEIIKRISPESSTVSLSLTTSHEGSITNLLEVILFHQDACEAMDSDTLLELADFCCRKLVYLNTSARKDVLYIEQKASDLINMCAEEEFKEKAASVRFQSSMCALTILRYLTDYINTLPLCIMARLIDKHDILLSLVPLTRSPPWKRERRKGKKLLLEKYEEGRWTEVVREDHYKVTKPDAQVWLAMYNLIMEPACRSRFKYDDFHKDQVLKLKKYLNELLLDQIPLLKDLQWVLEEISLNVKPKDEESKFGSLILEQVPALRERLLVKRNWDHIAKSQLMMTFTSDSNASSNHIGEMLRMFQFGESLEVPKCASCGVQAVQRCSRCKSEWYCGKSCQKRMWTYHKRLCDIMKDHH